MISPLHVLVLENHVIKFFDETNYRFDSTDNTKTYSKIFISGDKNSLTSKIGIEVCADDALKSSCLIGSEGGGTGINDHSMLISHDGLVICCSNTVFKLKMPDLDLEWKTIADTGTCFGIHYLDKDYVVHGELQISRLNKEGEIVWQQSGRDIWTTAESLDDFGVYNDFILATDWEYNRYKFDFNGNLLEEHKLEPNKTEHTNEIKSTKKWWKFW